MTSSSFTEIRRHSPSRPWTYALLDERQREIARRVREGGEGALLLSEVAPVITVGRRTQVTDLLFPKDRLARAGVEVLPTDRGGFGTYHGPGQWVLFAVDRLDRLTGDSRGVRKAVEGLLSIAVKVGRKYDESARCRDGAEMGAWSSRGKFAAVGIHIEQGVVLHGLAVNAFRTETSFLGLRPCGLDLPVDFLLGGVAPSEREEAFEKLGQELVDEALRTLWGWRASRPEPKPLSHRKIWDSL